jgi:hypothetical protein
LIQNAVCPLASSLYTMEYSDDIKGGHYAVHDDGNAVCRNGACGLCSRANSARSARDGSKGARCRQAAVPLHFRVLSVTIPPGEKSVLSGANGVLYQVSGFTEVSFGSDTKLLNAGEGLFIAGGAKADLKAGGPAPSTFLHFFLAPAAELDRPATKAPAAEREFYRTAAAIPGLKPGGYDINRTQVTFPAGMPSNPLTIGQERPCTSSSRVRGPIRSAARQSQRDRVP